MPVLELVLRGTLVYWLLFCLFDSYCGGPPTPHRTPWPGLPDGLRRRHLDMLAYRFPAVRRFSTAGRVTLIRDGVPQRRNLRQDSSR